MSSRYVYIYALEFKWFQTHQFLNLIIHLPQKLKIKMDMLRKIGLQLKINLEFNWI